MEVSYVPYPEYKESGVEWLDVIPRDWVVSRVKYLAPFQVGWTPPTKVDANFIGDNLWANISDLKDKYIKRTAKNISDEAAKAASMDISPKGSLLYSFKLSVGAVSFASQDMYTNEAIASFLEGGSLPLSYLYYALPKFVIENASTNIYGARILNQELINSALLLAPSYEEAEKIANFLDHETAKIDTLIEKQQQLIALLKEKRQAVISHAVTKGLHPDAPMRDSGVVSIGLMPEHWILKSLSLASKKLSVGLAMSVTDCYEEEGVPIIRNQNIKEGYFDDGDMLYLNPAFAEAQASKKVHAGDVVIVRTGSNVGLACCVPDEYDKCHTFTTLIVTPSNELVKEYFTYCMNSAYGKAEVNRLKFGFGKDNLNVGELRAMHTLLPPVKEQEGIVNFLKQEITKIELMVKKAYVAIGLMQERRTALISAAVTGKIDVRYWQAPQSSNNSSEAL
jgi:type I restriction enzyme S subunit